MNRRTKGVLSPLVHIFTLSCQISWTNTTAASPPSGTPEVIYGQADESFQGVLGEVKNFLFFLFYMLLVDFLLCEVCVFFHCKQHSTDMFLTASGDERGWVLNTKPKRFFFFSSRTRLKRISQTCLWYPAGVRSIKETQLEAKKGHSYWLEGNNFNL